LLKIQNGFKIISFQTLQQSLLILGKELLTHVSSRSVSEPAARGKSRCWLGVCDPRGGGGGCLSARVHLCTSGSPVSLSVLESG